jgi:hypothetical protein
MSKATQASPPSFIDYAVYFNGIHVPASEVVVSSGKNSPVSARISLPPHRLLTRFGAEDRVQVAVFYLDSWYDLDNPDYRLLFEGVITGFEYVTQAGRHQVSFTVQSNMGILQSLYLAFLSGKAAANDGRAKSDPEFPGQLKLRGRYPTQLFSDRLTGKGWISRPFDVVENIFRAVLGPHLDGTESSTPSDTDLQEELDKVTEAFLANAVAYATSEATDEIAKRTEKGARLTASDKAAVHQKLLDATLERALRDLSDPAPWKAAVAAINSEKTSDLGWSPSRDGPQRVFQYSSAYGEAPEDVVPGAKLVAAARKSLKEDVKKRLESRSRLSRSVTQTGFFARHMRLTRFVEHWMATPYFEGRPGGSKHPADTIMGGGAFPLLRSKNRTKLLKQLSRSSGTKGGMDAYSLLANTFANLYYEIVEVLAPPAHQLDAYSLPVAPLLDGLTTTDPETAAKQLAGRKRSVGIGTFLTKPDEPFAAPPACNVLFPSLVKQWSLQEDYASQPTRVYFNRKSHGRKLNLTTKRPGYAHQATRVGYPGVVVRHAQDAATSTSNDLELLVFPEEYYRGPASAMTDVPVMFQGMQAIAAAARFSNPTVVESTQPAESLDPSNLALSREAHTKASARGDYSYGLLADVAQQEYYRARTSRLSGSAVCVFHPYVIPCFPVAVFDSTRDGMHILGSVSAVQHHLSPTQASTSVSFTNVRTYSDMLSNLAVQATTGIHYGPVSPLPEIRDGLQNKQAAATIYAQLFYQADFSVGTTISEAARAAEQQAEQTLSRATTKQSRALIAVAEAHSALLATTAPGTERSDAETALLAADKLATTAATAHSKAAAAATDLWKTNWAEAAGSGSRSFSSAVPDKPTVYDYAIYFGWSEQGTKRGDETPIRLSNLDKKYDAEALNIAVGIPPGASVALLSNTRTTDILTDTTVALHVVSRPVCTLSEYAWVYAVAGRGKANLDPVGRGRGLPITSDEVIVVGLHPERHAPLVLRQFIGGPGAEPGSRIAAKGAASPYGGDRYSTDNKLSATTSSGRLELSTIDQNAGTVVVRVLKGGQTVTFDDLPDSRLDWQRLLLDYRASINSNEPQGGGF